MTVNVDYLPFCGTDTGSNLEPQSTYLADPLRLIGNQPGIASSQFVNKALRQSTFMAAQLAQFVSSSSNTSVLDDGVAATFLAQMQAVFGPKVPQITPLLSGSGTWNRSYVFTIASGNATLGATYTNNGVTFTVLGTVAASTQVRMSGSGAPNASGVLTKASGTGDATINFYVASSALYLRVRMVGPGGGGGGSSTANDGGNGGNATNTTFGTSLLVATGGAGGGGASTNTNGGAGGSASLGTGPVGIAVTGGNGGGAVQGLTTGTSVPGGMGGSSALGGAGGGTSGINTSVGGSGAPNTGGGGGGAGGQNNRTSGSGGGSGGFIDAIIASGLAASYTFNVAPGGSAGNPGTGGSSGGAGGSGLIEITEYFQ